MNDSPSYKTQILKKNIRLFMLNTKGCKQLIVISDTFRKYTLFRPVRYKPKIHPPV